MDEENLEVLKIEELEENLKELENWITRNETPECLENFKNNTENGVLKFKSPDKDCIFNALKLLSPKETKVLIIGQDPYPGGDKINDKFKYRADGLAFSFGNGAKADDSLLNIFKAIKVYKGNFEKYFCDISKEIDWDTNLEVWAKNNGILLLNTALTHENDNKDTIKLHRNTWEKFIQQVIKKLINCKLSEKDKEKEKLAVFLWGKDAQETFLKCFSDNNLNKPLKIFKNHKYPGIIWKNDKFEFRESSFKLINEKNEIAIDNNIDNIKIYMTSHPCNMSVKKGFCHNAPRHFEACDKFLGENIWLNFPENNQ